MHDPYDRSSKWLIQHHGAPPSPPGRPAGAAPVAAATGGDWAGQEGTIFPRRHVDLLPADVHPARVLDDHRGVAAPKVSQSLAGAEKDAVPAPHHRGRVSRRLGLGEPGRVVQAPPLRRPGRAGRHGVDARRLRVCRTAEEANEPPVVPPGAFCLHRATGACGAPARRRRTSRCPGSVRLASLHVQHRPGRHRQIAPVTCRGAPGRRRGSWARRGGRAAPGGCQGASRAPASPSA
jgi:hypothetical protein